MNPLSRPWTNEEQDQLRDLYPTKKTRDLVRVLCRSFKAIRSRAKLLGIRKQKPRRYWTLDELEEFKNLYPNVRSTELAKHFDCDLDTIYRQATRFGIHKSAAYLASPDACRLRRGDNVGEPFRFKKGQIPHNKGLRRPGWFRGRMRETQFKKGNHPHTWRPIGTLRISKDGYLERKIRDAVPVYKNWRAVHLLLWEEKNGPLAKGYAIAFKDGNKNNITYENLECISRAELMKRNSIHQRMPPELKEVIMLTGAIKRQIREKKEKQHGKS